MKDLWNKTVAGFAVWKLAWIKAGLVTFVAGATTYQTSMAGIEWSAMSTTQQSLVAVGILVTMANALIAFLDRTLTNITEQKEKDEHTKIFVAGPKTQP